MAPFEPQPRVIRDLDRRLRDVHRRKVIALEERDTLCAALADTMLSIAELDAATASLIDEWAAELRRLAPPTVDA